MKRRELILLDDGTKLTVKLWDEHSEKSFDIGQRVTITNLRTSVFNGITTANSTEETEITAQI